MTLFLLLLTLFLPFILPGAELPTPVEAAAHSIVLLKNDESALPFLREERIAFFRPGELPFIVSGEGSGKVRPSVNTTPQEALAGSGIHFSPTAGELFGVSGRPWYNDENLRAIRQEADCAVVFISRIAGEGHELYNQPGSMLPSAEETEFFSALKRRGFRKTILILNTPAGMSPEFFTHCNAAIWCGFPGQGGSEALIKILQGEISPSGRLTGTWANSLEDYPGSHDYHEHPEYVDYTEDIFIGYRYFSTFDPAGSQVCFPFGYGLSYTTFSRRILSCNLQGNLLKADVKVTNTGTAAARETLQLYCKAPQGELGKPCLVLAAFGKTPLLAPGESVTVTLNASLLHIASYDDTGKSGFPHAWVLEAGKYEFTIGDNVLDAARQQPFYTFDLPETRMLQQLQSRIPPQLLEKRLLADGSCEKLPVSGKAPDYRDGLISSVAVPPLSGSVPARGPMLTFQQAAAHPRELLPALIAQLSDEELLQMLSGLPSLIARNGTGRIGANGIYGIPAEETTDGPSGIHLRGPGRPVSTSWPAPSILACSWDTELLMDTAAAIAEESARHGCRIWLAPSMNLQRIPKNGRNFEYFSEDPLLSGKLAAAMITGAQSRGVAATPKHFFANSREFNRDSSDSRLSERAARELYLRNFHIAITEGRPWALMSSYNLANGTEVAENRALLHGILREEWGFDGLIMTDWGNNSHHVLEAAAGNNVKMPSGHINELREAIRNGTLSRKQLEEHAKYIITMLMRIHATCRE